MLHTKKQYFCTKLKVIFTLCKFNVNTVKCALQTNMKQIKRNIKCIPAGWRQTSWPFRKHGGVEFGTTEYKSSLWQKEGFKPGFFSDYKSSTLITTKQQQQQHILLPI